MKISNRMLITFGTIYLVVSILIVVLVNYNMRKQALIDAESKALMLINHNLAIHTYLQELKPKLFSWSEPFRPPDYFDPTWMSSTYAIRQINHHFKLLENSKYYYKECAINARTPENEADLHERIFLGKLTKDPKLVERAEVRTLNGQPVFVIMRRGLEMKKSCLRCHSTPDRAPGDLVKLYGPTRSFGRLEGEVVHAISIRIPSAEAYGQANRLSWHLSGILLALLGGLFASQTWISKRWLYDPMAALRQKALEIAESDARLGETMPVPPGPELRDLTAAFNTMSRNLRQSHDTLEDRVRQRTMDLNHLNERLEQDILLRKRAEEALRESEARFRATFEEANLGIELVDANGQMAETNHALQKMLGYSGEELRGRSFTDFTHPDDLPSNLKLFQECMQGERSSFHIEKRYIRKDGGIVWVNVSVSKTFVMEGRPNLAINLVEDITEHKLADERLRAYQEQLRSLTSELTRAEERERRQLAEELHDQIGQLLAISKMKMGALKKKAATAGLEKPLEEVRGYLDQAIKSTRSLTHELAPPLVHLGLEGALEWLAEQLQAHYGLTVTLEKDDRPQPLGLETSTMLFRAVRELLMNVVKHAQAHQARVAILRPDGEVHIEVQDDGIGMKSDRIDPRLGEVGKFGLFSIMERLQSVGGQLKIDSQPGQGTTVTIIMPLKAEDASATEK